MRKFGLMVGLALCAIACGAGADVVGEMMDSGVPDAGAQGTGGTPGGSPSLNWIEVSCDQYQEKLTYHSRSYKTECVRDAENRCLKDEYNRTIYERVELNSETKQYQRFVEVAVADVARVHMRYCGQDVTTHSPPLPPDDTSGHEVLAQDHSLGECWAGIGVEHTDSTIFVRCGTRSESTYNQASEYCTSRDCTDRTSISEGRRYWYAEF